LVKKKYKRKKATGIETWSSELMRQTPTLGR